MKTALILLIFLSAQMIFAAVDTRLVYVSNTHDFPSVGLSTLVFDVEAISDAGNVQINVFQNAIQIDANFRAQNPSVSFTNQLFPSPGYNTTQDYRTSDGRIRYIYTYASGAKSTINTTFTRILTISIQYTITPGDGSISWFAGLPNYIVADGSNIIITGSELSIPIELSVIPLGEILSSPTNLTAVADTFSVNLNWTDNSDNETGFVIERKDGDSLSANPYIKIDTVLANVTTFTNTGLIPNTTYTYRVFAFNDIGVSSYSNLRQVTTIGMIPLWLNQILVKDAGGTESSQVLTFGQHTDATDSLDSSLGEYELPPPPPTGIFDARFNLPTNLQVSSFIDYRDSAKTDIIWNMTFQPGSAGYAMTFNWDSTAFPEGTFYLKDGINGSFVNVNMKFKSCYILTDSNITSLNIMFDREGINPAAPSAPTNLTAIADNYSVTLNWADNSDNEIGFIIERKDGDSTSVNPFIKIDTVVTDETAYINIGLTPNTTYTYRVFAFNDYYVSGYSNLAQITTPALPATFQLTVSVFDGWNMVSAPGLHPTNQNVETWWPNRTGSVFEYNGIQYIAVTNAVVGKGYWMNNTVVETYSYPAIQIVPHDPIPVTINWNMIGGYELSPTIVSLKAANPQITGSVFEYNGIQYIAATNLVPGYGYWVNVTSAGSITIPDAMAKGNEEVEELFKEGLPTGQAGWGRIVMTDARGISTTLYAVKGEVNLDEYSMPPLPPAGSFDIRFSSQRIAEDINSAIKTIDMVGVIYPLTVRVEGMDIRLQDLTGKAINQNLKSGEEIVIGDATINKLMVTGELIPAEYALEQNYPNPFNPSTVIEFSLPEDVGNVKLSLYNALGEKVAEPVNTALTAGKYQYQWNARDVATGIYIYELRTEKFVSVKKMVLMK